MNSKRQAIGILDSGLGGLSVLRQVQGLLPHEDLLYFADQAHIPYGNRSAEQVRSYTLGIARFLQQREAKAIVVACNTASAAALDYLRARLPNMPIIGMEPALKPGAAETSSGAIGVLATPGTFTSPRFKALLNRYTEEINVFEDPCRGLVEQIERGEIATPETRAILEAAVSPMLEAGVDTIVLGCTHYPFILKTLRTLVGPQVKLIDPSPAVAKQTARVLQQRQLTSSRMSAGTINCFTTGDSNRFKAVSKKLIGTDMVVGNAHWLRNNVDDEETLSV